MIGQPVPRRDARDKSLGRAAYVADLHPPDAWFGVTVRSAVVAGHLRRVAPGPTFPHDEAVCVTAEGLGGRNRLPMITDEMPFLAETQVRYRGEPVALVAARTRAAARRAAAAVVVEIDPAPPLFTLTEAEEAYRRDADSVPVFAEYRIRRGDPERALAESPIVVSGTYRTPAADQAYIEPQGMIAWPHARGGIIIEGSLQCPYYVHPALVRLLGCDPHEVIVRQAPTGGAFGGKEDFPSLIAGHAALLAHACGYPVKLIYSRNEDLLFTTKRHPSIVRRTTGMTPDGRLQAMRIEILLDGGAYTTLSPVVLARAVLTAPGPYECPHVEVHGLCLGTHTPPTGAFRGFGAPQVMFASEVHMDELAARVKLPPDEIRRRNLVRVGSVTASGQTLRESVGADAVLDRALKASDFRARWSRLQRETPSGGKRHGIGLALVWHGGGFTGSGEQRLTSRAAVTIEPDDSLRIRVANVEMGQGTATVLPQIAAARLGIPLERVACARPDTAEVPNSGPTVASRTVMIVGSLIDDCASQLGEALCAAIASRQGTAHQRFEWRDGAVHLADDPSGLAAASFDEALAVLRAQEGPLRFEAVYRIPAWLHWDEEKFRGDAYAAYSYACTVVELEVDAATGEVKPLRLVAACDAGRAINPQTVAGQIEGGALQGLGFALLERVTMRDGTVEQDRFQTYLIPTAPDAPEIEAHIVEEPYSGGPGGAKGMGEIPISGPPPAVANAIAQAVGWRPRALPITPERIVSQSSGRDLCRTEDGA